VNAVPAWEQLTAFVAVLLIAAVIPFGFLQVWRRYRRNALALIFAIASLAYPFTLILRLARGGSEIANRSWNFLFVGLGFVLAVAVAELWMTRPRGLLSPRGLLRHHAAADPGLSRRLDIRVKIQILPRAAVFALFATVIYFGALVVGMPPWARLPGRFMVGGDTRGLQAESYALADWAREVLGPDNRFIGDYTNKWLLGSFGEQYIVDGLSWVYISPKLTAPDELADIVGRDAQYIVVDMRVTEDVPRIGHYFEPGEPKTPHREPLPRERMLKFDREPCLTRIYDSGNIIVYAVGPACAAALEGTQ
jgi:hypothetical protein